MPANTHCPDCQRTLRVPDNLIGKKVKCPSCGTTFTASVGAEELPTAQLGQEEAPLAASGFSAGRPEDEYEEDEAPRRRRPPAEEEEEGDFEEEAGDPAEAAQRLQADKKGWAKVRSGLTLNIVSICLGVLAILVLSIGIGILVLSSIANVQKNPPGGAAPAQVAPPAPQPAPKVELPVAPGKPAPGQPALPAQGAVQPGVAPASPAELKRAMEGNWDKLKVVFLVFVAMQVAAHLTALAGYFLCLQVPPRNKARGMVLGAIALAIGSLLFSIITGIVFYNNKEAILATFGQGAAGQGVAMRDNLELGIFSNIASCLDFIKHFVFILFLMAVAKSVRAQGLVKSARYLAIIVGIGIVCYIIGVILNQVFAKDMAAFQPGAAPGAQPNLGPRMAVLAALGGCGCVQILLGLTGFVWYLVALAQTRAQISTYLSRR